MGSGGLDGRARNHSGSSPCQCSNSHSIFLSNVCQPELLAGKRYNEDVDTYSFGVVLFEIAAARLPYAKERQAYKESGGKGVNMKMMREISKGLRKPELAGEPGCRRFRVGGSFKKCRSSFLAFRVHVALLLIARRSLCYYLKQYSSTA